MPKDDQKELFIVVDKDDKILEYRTRYDCHHDKSLIHRGVEIVIFNTKGEVLLQKRSKKKDLFAGYYTVSTGGHVTRGESYLKTAKRELKEELGIKTELKKRKKLILENEFETEMDIIYRGVHNGPFNIDPDEVKEVEFFSLRQLKKLTNKLTPFSSRVLKELKIL